MKKELAAVPPKETPVALRNPVPVIVTAAPPPETPVDGLSELIVGAETALYVKWSADPVVEVPVGVVTVMSMVPAAPAGEEATMEVSEITVKKEAAVVPKFTAEAPVKFVPVIVTTVPPEVKPDVAVTPVTAGAVAALYV